MDPKKHIWFLTIIAGITVGTLPAFTHVALETMNPGTITIVRYVDTMIGLFGLALVTRTPLHWKRVWTVLPISLFAAINAICFAIGVHYIQAASIQLFYTVIPMIVAVLSWYILHQPTSPAKIIGLIIGLAGVILVVLAPLIQKGAAVAFHPLGTFLVLIGALCFSLYSVLSKPAQDKASPSDILMSTAIMTIVCQAVLMIVTRTPLSIGHVSLRSFGASLVVGFIGTGFFYWLYQYIVKISNPLVASVTQYIMPFFGALWAYVIIGDHLTLLTIIGGAIALVGAAQVNGIWRLFNNKTSAS